MWSKSRTVWLFLAFHEDLLTSGLLRDMYGSTHMSRNMSLACESIGQKLDDDRMKLHMGRISTEFQ